MAERVSLAARFDSAPNGAVDGGTARRQPVLLTVGVSMVSLFSTSIERGNVAPGPIGDQPYEDEASHLRAQRTRYQLRGQLGVQTLWCRTRRRYRAGSFRRRVPDAQAQRRAPGDAGQNGARHCVFMPGEMTDTAMPITSARFNGQIVAANGLGQHRGGRRSRRDRTGW